MIELGNVEEICRTMSDVRWREKQPLRERAVSCEILVLDSLHRFMSYSDGRLYRMAEGFDCFSELPIVWTTSSAVSHDSNVPRNAIYLYRKGARPSPRL